MSNALFNGWRTTKLFNEKTGEKTIHVVPVRDLREHTTNDCWCIPQVDTSEEIPIIIHNALDRREEIETGKARMQ